MKELSGTLARNLPFAIVAALLAVVLSLSCAQPAAAAVTKTVLPNGLCVIVKPEPGSGLVAIEAFVKAGAAQERNPLMGIGNLVARILLTSARNRSPARLSAAFEEVGGSFRTDWSPDFTEISAMTTVTHFDEAMNLLADVLLNEEFDPEMVEPAKEAVLAQIKGDGGGVFEAVYNQMLESLYKDNPYRRPKVGYAQCVRRITRDEVLAFRRQWYVPSNIVISVAGDVAEQQVLDRLKRGFAGTGLTLTPPQRPIGEETLAQSVVRITEKDTFAAYIMIGYLAPGVRSPDFPALTVASAILGGGKASRLFTNLREQRGIGYEVGTLYPILRNQSHLIALVVTDLYKPAIPGAPSQVALQEIKDATLAEVASLRDRLVSDEELLRAKRYAVGSHALKRQRLRERAFHLGWMEAIGAGYQFDQEFGSRIDAVTKEDVQRVARKYLTNYAMVVGLPKNSPAIGSPFGARN